MLSKYAKAVVAAVGGAVVTFNSLVLDLGINLDSWVTHTVAVVTAVATTVGVWWKKNAPVAEETVVDLYDRVRDEL